MFYVMKYYEINVEHIVGLSVWAALGFGGGRPGWWQVGKK
jgi:hypothetical protein